MKKRFKVLSLILATLFALPAFLGAASPAEGVRRSSAPVEITFWSIFPIGDPKLAELEALIAQFEAQNPGIRVRHTGFSFWDYWGRLRTAQAGRTDPDVSFNDNASVQIRARSGVIRSLQPFIDASGTDIYQFGEGDRRLSTWQGEMYAFMFSSDFRLLFFNRDHFREAGLPDRAPTTIEELKEFADKLDVWEGNSLRRAAFHPRMGNNSFYTDVWNVGGEFFTPEGRPNFDCPIVIKGLQQYVDLCRRYTIRQFNGFMSQTQASTLDPFVLGLSSMVVHGDWFAWELQHFRNQFPDDPTFDFDWSVAPYPHTEGNRTSWGNGFTLEMSARTTGDRAEAAFRFMEFMAQPEVQKLWPEKFQMSPANEISLQLLLDDPSTPPQARKIFTEAAYRRSPDVNFELPEWWIFVTPELDSAIAGHQTVEEAAANIQAQLLNRMGIEAGRPDYPLLIGIFAFIGFTIIFFVVTGIIDRKRKI